MPFRWLTAHIARLYFAFGLLFVALVALGTVHLRTLAKLKLLDYEIGVLRHLNGIRTAPDNRQKAQRAEQLRQFQERYEP